MAPSLPNNGTSNGYGSTITNPSTSWFGGRSTTDSATQGSYQSVPTNTNHGDAKELSLYEDAEARLGRRRLFQVAKIAVLCGLAIAAYSFFRGDNSSHSYQDANSNPYAPLPVSGKRQPFSRLHPVHDLGVPAFSRPKDSRPQKVLTDKNNNQDKPFFPTNAWYQNMLLVQGDEPTDINRAYATPFVVDAVGPVPGLRVLPNTVAASTSVIQLNVLEAAGLTIGAAPDAKKKKKEKHKKHSERSLKEEKAVDTSNLKEEEKAVEDSPNTNTTTDSSNTTTTNSTSYSKEYSVERMTPLGLTLAWEKTLPMTSSIVKGMPYGTMIYDAMQFQDDDKDIWFPTVASEIPLAKNPVVDGGKTTLICLGGVIAPPTTNTTSDGSNSTAANNSTTDSTTNSTRRLSEHHHSVVQVEREIELHFADSDFTWLVFVSRPVSIQCVADPESNGIHLQVVNDEEDTIQVEDDDATSTKAKAPFVMRIAVAKVCTSNKNPIYCHHEEMMPGSLGLGQGRYDDLLRKHSHLVPGPETGFDYDVDDAEQQINIEFDWDVRDMKDYEKPVKSSKHKQDKDLIVFALPHHLDLMGTRNAPGYLKYCAATLIGPACLLSGSKWTMVESVPHIDFRAPRPPAPWAVKDLAKSAREDIGYRLPERYRQGEGDTYFSGKMLAKLGRILTITEELQYLCGQKSGGSIAKGYKEACQGAKLPSDRAVKKAVASLRSSVEIWLNGKAKTPFVYDEEWGGVVSCGCNNPDGGKCQNKFPECPAFTDPGLNFGNAFYNDLHFHYGYHIFAAAVVSHFDPDWGKEFFERVMLLVRNIANPADSGDYFQSFRHKDWYQGHSWASGVVPPYLNGRNQESSSESIAAYEAVALYGTVMTSVFENESHHSQNAQVAKEVRKAGQILTATELRSTRRYYHVRDEGNANQALKIYPSEYTNHAIGMMWNTMAQYQTWFGGKPYLAAGIQLLPITPIAEQRDGVQWLTEMYPSFANTCAANKDCKENGWSVLQIASLATIGYRENATKEALDLPAEVFTSAGGNGHSLTNTLWYIASRPIVKEPADIEKATEDEPTEDEPAGAGNSTSADATAAPREDYTVTDCYQPQVCTDYVLNTIADEYSCRQRMTDLINTMGHTEEEACFMVAKIQFPKQCGACNPNATKSAKVFVPQCPPCTVRQCESDFNKCPQFSQTFVCTNGPNKGGCSRFPWDVRSEQCNSCCELSECIKKHGF